MEGVNKVLWKEGLFLTPQHFQSFDRYHEWLSGFLVQTLSQYHWGFHKLTIDEEAIANWQFNVGTVQAILRNGVVVDCPGCDSLPSARSFESLLTPDKNFLTAYLCLPRQEPGRPAVKMTEQTSGQHRPFERILRETSDMVTGTGAREIEFLVKKPEIRFDGEALDNFDLLPMARIILKGAGKPAIAPNFLPPSLSLGASALWMSTVEHLFREVNQLATELRG
ncbi:MAG: type VI secretion system baseplate subunit TssK, partial [bacterium]|nr:type VI secretion system baseplate subunit TssK [bacterium]